QQIRRAGKDRLLAYHICDWLVPTRDLLNDRGMMGDGVIDLPRLRGWVEGAGYGGLHEVEIFSEYWWQRDPDEVLAIIKERHAATRRDLLAARQVMNATLRRPTAGGRRSAGFEAAAARGRSG